MSMAKFNIEIMLKKRNIKTFAVVADDDFIFMNVLDTAIPAPLYYNVVIAIYMKIFTIFAQHVVVKDEIK
jgi:hypothetical protein